MRLRSLYRAAGPALSLCVFAGLAYAAFWIKPAPLVPQTSDAAIEPRDHFYGIALAEGGVWAVGTDGKIVHADDMRSPHWAIQRSGFRVNLQSIDAWDGRRAVAVGNDGLVIVTHDGGTTWIRAAAPVSGIDNKLVRVRALPDGLAYAVGEYNLVLRSPDFGSSWQRLTPERDTAWYGLDTTPTKVVVVGEGGRALILRQNGSVITAVQTPARSPLTAVSFSTEEQGVAVGLNGVVIHTSDGGASWRLVPSGYPEHIYDVLWDGSRYVACGERGLLIVSDDGLRWSLLGLSVSAQRNALWFTQVRQAGRAYMLAGATVAVADGARLNDVAKPGPH